MTVGNKSPSFINARKADAILIDEHRYDEAMAAVQELRDDAALRRNSQHYISKSYYLEGLCREALGDTAGAEASIEKAVEWADKIYFNSNHVDLPVFLNKLAQNVQDERISKEIADKLCLSVRTVENHRRSLYQKLGVGNSAELIKIIGQYLQ